MSNCLSSDPVKTTPFVQLGPKDQSMTQLCWYRHSQNSSFKILPLSGLEMKRIESGQLIPWNICTEALKKKQGDEIYKGFFLHFHGVFVVVFLRFIFHQSSKFTSYFVNASPCWCHLKSLGGDSLCKLVCPRCIHLICKSPIVQKERRFGGLYMNQRMSPDDSLKVGLVYPVYPLPARLSSLTRPLPSPCQVACLRWGLERVRVRRSKRSCSKCCFLFQSEFATTQKLGGATIWGEEPLSSFMDQRRNKTFLPKKKKPHKKIF